MSKSKLRTRQDLLNEMGVKLPKSSLERMKELLAKQQVGRLQAQSNQGAAAAERGRKELERFTKQTQDILARGRATQDQLAKSRQMTQASVKAAQDLARRSRGGR